MVKYRYLTSWLASTWPVGLFYSNRHRVNTMAAYQEDMDDLAKNFRRFMQFHKRQYIDAEKSTFYGLGKEGFDNYAKYKEGAKSA